MDLHFTAYRGAEIRAIIAPLAQLRIAVFYDFPYLYEGTMAYEARYLNRYADTGESFVFAIWDGDKMVGATTGMPLKFETDDIRQPFLDNGMDTAPIFYFGESVLLQPYRGQGLGHRFFDERERFAQSLGYEAAAFCAVVRPDTHPLKPAGYRSNDAFWTKRGYVQQPALVCRMQWLDREETMETFKPLVFWYRNLK